MNSSCAWFFFSCWPTLAKKCSSKPPNRISHAWSSLLTQTRVTNGYHFSPFYNMHHAGTVHQKHVYFQRTLDVPFNPMSCGTFSHLGFLLFAFSEEWITTPSLIYLYICICPYHTALCLIFSLKQYHSFLYRFERIFYFFSIHWHILLL